MKSDIGLDNSGEVLMVTRSFWEAQTVGSTPTTATNQI